MLRFLILSICIVYFVSFTYSQESPSSCIFTDPSTNLTYDLSSLSLSSNEPLSSFYYFNDTSGDSAGNYVANICAPVNVTLFPTIDSNTAVLQVDFSNNTFSCGLVTNSSFSAYGGAPSTNGQGVRVSYGNGTFCNAISAGRVTTIDIGCDPTNQGEIVNVTEPLPCNYYIQMWASAACATNPSSSPVPSPVPTVNTTCPSPVPTVNNTCPSPVPTVNNTCNSPVPSLTNSTTSSPTRSLTNSTTPSLTNSTTPSLTNSTTPSLTNSTTPSLTNSTTPSLTNSTAASVTSPTTSSGIPSWVWWVLASVLVLILIIAACIAGFVIWKKKQQQNYDFDPIDYE